MSSIQHPKRDEQIPIINYHKQTFRLISVFSLNQAEEAKAFWRDLTDNQGKACVLLEEPQRFSIWGKIRLEQFNSDVVGERLIKILRQACILLLQTVELEIEDLFGSRQAGLFKQDIIEILQQRQFPQAELPALSQYIFTINPLLDPKVPLWQERHLIILLQELHRLGKRYLGNSNFATQIVDTLEDMPERDRSEFIHWLNQSSLAKLWH